MSKEEKMMILEMVAQGKITPEQGAELLRAVGSVRSPLGSLGEEVSKTASRTLDKAKDIRDEALDRARYQAEEAAKKVQEVTEEAAKKAQEIGEKTSTHLEENAANLGKMISQIFSFGFGTKGPEFEFHDEIRGDIPPEGEIDVSMDTTNGRITIETWDEPFFHCDVKKKVSARDEEEAKELLKDAYEFTHDGLKIHARSKETKDHSWGRNLSVGFTLKLPKHRKASLNLDSANGRITLTGTEGTKLVADTANGRVEASRCNYDSANIDTANGRIEFEGSAGELRLDTANGRIEARLKGHGAWKCDTANGRIEVEVQKEDDIGYEIDASSVMGRIDVSGMGEAQVLVDDTKDKMGSKRYKARTKGFEDAPKKATLKASSAMGKVTVTLL